MYVGFMYIKVYKLNAKKKVMMKDDDDDKEALTLSLYYFS
jgi:hypothetical protein